MAIPGVNFVFTYVDYAILLIPLAVAVGTFTFKMVNSGGAIDFSNQNEAITSILLVIAPIIGFCGAILRLYARLAYYQSMLSMTLLRKNMTSNEGTISYLIHSAGKQARPPRCTWKGKSHACIFFNGVWPCSLIPPSCPPHPSFIPAGGHRVSPRVLLPVEGPVFSRPCASLGACERG